MIIFHRESQRSTIAYIRNATQRNACLFDSSLTGSSVYSAKNYTEDFILKTKLKGKQIVRQLQIAAFRRSRA